MHGGSKLGRREKEGEEERVNSPILHTRHHTHRTQSLVSYANAGAAHAELSWRKGGLPVPLLSSHDDAPLRPQSALSTCSP